MAEVATVPASPRFEMIPNTDFSFPMQPTPLPHRRPASMHINLPPPTDTANTHRRAVSILPSFTFNEKDASGLQDDETKTTPPQTPDDNVPVTPRRGHRRGGSEFVGGDSRFGVSNALSSSPTKTNAFPLPVPSTGGLTSGRHHVHRRSVAMSSQDVGSIIQPTEIQPRLSSSLPCTPLEHPTESPIASVSPAKGEITDPFGPPLEDVVTRPPSRPRVGFSDNVEIIPRPLSTISSETESSISTLRGHSQHNSINSLISLGAASPPPRKRMSLTSPIEDASTSERKSSFETGKRVEKEGAWLKSRPADTLKRPLSEPVMTPKTTFVTPDPPVRARHPHNKKHPFTHALGFDRRRSEPSIGMHASEPSRLSTISLQESLRPQSALDIQAAQEHEHEHVSSARKLKQWAASKISRKRPTSAGSASVPEKAPSPDAVAETDLDAVLSSEDTFQRPASPVFQRVFDMDTPVSSYSGSFQSRELDSSPVLDLDAALGPFNTPSFGPHGRRRELHSSRLYKDFSGPGGHYHRRTESAPALTPFENRTPPQSPMADVFEEDEDDENENDVSQSKESGSTEQATSHSWRSKNGLGISGDWEPERPSTSYGNASFSGLHSEPRGSSIMEETIMEETSPVEVVEIVEAHEEPRASSLTKSSDSSETPTLLATSGMLTLPDGQQSLKTPDTYQTSTFSSPDFGRQQGSFDTSRLGTSASSIPSRDLRVSVDDVPSLTSSRSTMLTHNNNSRRDLGASRTPSATSGAHDGAEAAERRRKRSSIQSLSQLVGMSKAFNESRPQTAIEAPKKKKEHRLKKLMFWRSKQHR